MKSEDRLKVEKWWENSIIDMKPGCISFRGSPIEDLMEAKSFSQMMLLVILGKNLTPEEAKLFEVAMVMSVDHGPQAPSIAIARMSSTCGISINNVLASAINVLGDNHGGAGQGCAELFYAIAREMNTGTPMQRSVADGLAAQRAKHGKTIPGYGHRFHKKSDPRALKTVEIVESCVRDGHISGVFKDIALEVQRQISQGKSMPIPMNVDGAAAIIFCELGIPAPLCRGLFCLARGVGILAHAWEEMQSGTKNKGPIPRDFIPYYKQSGVKDDHQ